MKKTIWLFGLLIYASTYSAIAAITVLDDAGNTVKLPQPAQRIVTLSPHVTELVFAAGAGKQIVGTVDHSDYPPAARALPRVGSHRQIDIERLIALKPDLLVVWLHGNAERQLEPLRRLGIPLFHSEPKSLAAVPDTLQRIGKLAGTSEQADRTASDYRSKLDALAAKYQGKPLVKVFYQVWDRPLYTLNDTHIVSDAIRLCGGENVFGKLAVTAPVVTAEAVLLANPEAIISGNRPNQDESVLESWKKFPNLRAVQRGNLFAVESDLLIRPAPRIVQGAADLCEKLEQARQRRKP